MDEQPGGKNVTFHINEQRASDFRPHGRATSVRPSGRATGVGPHGRSSVRPSGRATSVRPSGRATGEEEAETATDDAQVSGIAVHSTT